MLSFVKSLFISTTPPREPPAESSSEEASESSSSDVEEIDPPGSPKKEDAAKERSSERKSGSRESDLLEAGENQGLRGALYLVDGTSFECLMPQCTPDIDGRLLAISPFEKHLKARFLRIDRICHFRQHLPDAFQFLVREGKDGGEEYGLQFESPEEAVRFRHLMFDALLGTTTTVPEVSVACAMAEYDTQNREFVVISKSVEAQIRIRPSDSEAFFTIVKPERTGADHDENDVPNEIRLFCEPVSREIQVWPSPQTNQLTFWGIDYRRPGIEKRMYLIEMNPVVADKKLISKFFNQLGLLLQDRGFLIDLEDGGKTVVEEIPDVMDQQFDVGPLGDEKVHREWRQKGRRSSVGLPSDDGGDEESPSVYTPSYPMYSSSTGKDPLLHRFMEVGTDRTFVCRGDGTSSNYYTRRKGKEFQMSVYKSSEGPDGEDVLETVGTVGANKFSYGGELFLPNRGLLHQQEKKLLVTPEGGHDGTVYLMDIGTEKVVQKFDADGTQIGTMFPTFKTGQASVDPTFLCSNPRNVFMMDTRSHKHAKSTSISYLTNPQLSVGVTDEEGHILMGSRLGELRLYDGGANPKGDFKRAKTLLQSIREPIIAVDVTKDGSWIVATTKTFLVVFCTRLAGSGRTGFTTALGQAKPAPRYLMLTAEDLVKYQITEINFAPAKFDSEEDSIVTSTGNMAVVWDFGTVKRGKPFYSIRFAEDAIRDVQIAADSANVVVAYPTAVGLFGTERRSIE